MREHVKYRLQEIEKAIAAGWSLTPLRGKVPILDSWQSQKSPALAQALEWGKAGNVGLRTGRASGVYVVDVDSEKGGDAAPLHLPETATVETGGGGLHLYFKMPEGMTLKNTAGRLGKAIDTRGDGGQVVFVGSVHPVSGKVYRWKQGLSAEEVGLADLPEAILEKLKPKQRKVRHELAGSAYAVAALHNAVREIQIAPEGQRNDTLNKSSFGLGQLIAGRQILECDVVASLEGAALAAGLEEREIRDTIKSGLEAGKQHPRVPRGRPPKLPTPEDVNVEREPDTDERPETLIPGPHTDADGNYTEVGNHDFVNAVLGSMPPDTLYRRSTIVGEITGKQGRQTFAAVRDGRLRAIVDQHIRCYRWHTPIAKNAVTEERYVTCTYDLATLVLEGAARHERIRELKLLTSYPVCAGDDWQILTPGWNPDAGAFYDEPPGLHGLEPRLDVDEQRGILLELVCDFPFQDDASRENMYGLLLTPILRPGIDGNVPMHLITSPLERTGKTKLAEEVFGGIILGRPTPAIQLTGSDEERDKRILALLLRGDTLVHFDNVRQFLDSAALASLITSQTYSGRPMARSEIASPPNTLTIVASGNNVRMSGELAKRTVPIVLAPTTDEPEARTDYEHPDLRKYVKASRRRVLEALLGMVENWKRAGSPLARKPLGGFERWSAVIGGILKTAGFESWRGNADAWKRKANADGEDLRIFVEAWSDALPESASVKNLFELAEQLSLFGNLIRGKTDHGRLQSFSRMVLARNEDAPVSRWRIKAHGYGSARRWYLEEI